MKKLTETLWIDDELGLAIAQPEGRSDWIVFNWNSAVMFGPNNFGNCKQFVEARRKNDT